MKAWEMFFLIVFIVNLSYAQNHKIEIAPVPKTIKGSVELSVLIQEKVKDVSVLVGETALIAKLKEKNWVCTWDTQKSKDGSYQIKAKATTEKEEILLSSAITVVVDNTPPKISFKSFEQKGKSVSFFATLEENVSTPATVEFSIDNKIIAANLEKNVFIGKWQIPEKAKTQYTLSIKANDSVRNEKTIQQNILLDIAVPEIKILTKLPKKINKVTCDLTIKDSSSISNVSAKILGQNNAKIEMIQKEKIWQMKWLTPKDGKYNVVVSATDSKGNKGILNFSIEVDITSPGLKWQQQKTIDEKVKLSIIPSEKVTSIELMGDKKSLGYFQKTGQKNWEITFKAPGEGVFPIEAKAMDIAGNWGKSKQIEIIYDKTPPKIIDKQLSPNKLQIGAVQVNINYKDNVAGIDTNIKPTIFFELKGKSYLFEITKFTSQKCQATLLVTEEHVEHTGKIYLKGLVDQAGNKIAKTILGQLEIDKPGGSWPLVIDTEYTLLKRDTSKNLSIQGKVNDSITAIEDGEIIEIYQTLNGPGFVKVQRLRGNFIWEYHHISAIKNPETKNYLTLGDIVKEGDILGKLVQAQSNLPSYLLLKLKVKKEPKDILKYLKSAKTKYIQIPKKQVVKKTEKKQPKVSKVPEKEKTPKKTSAPFGGKDIVIIVYFLMAIGVIGFIYKY